MDTILKKASGGKTPDKVQDLNLDNQSAGSDLSFLKPFSALQFLSLNNCRVSSLQSFPKLESLVLLELADNKLSGGFEPLAACSALAKVDLTNNRIENVADLAGLASAPALESLVLKNNPISERATYRDEVFKLIATLEVIDGLNRYESTVLCHERVLTSYPLWLYRITERAKRSWMV
jgi:Leucine-rich repeat (LRR) protein